MIIISILQQKKVLRDGNDYHSHFTGTGGLTNLPQITQLGLGKGKLTLFLMPKLMCLDNIHYHVAWEPGTWGMALSCYQLLLRPRTIQEQARMENTGMQGGLGPWTTGDPRCWKGRLNAHFSRAVLVTAWEFMCQDNVSRTQVHQDTIYLGDKFSRTLMTTIPRQFLQWQLIF